MNVTLKIAPIAFLISILVFTPFVSLAHGDGGSFEKEVGEYFIDIGYSPKEPYVGGAVAFDFSLSKNDVPEDFSDVWVRISKEGKTIFAGGVHNASFGGARLSLALPESGEYTVSSRYQNENDEIVSVEFPISVDPSVDGDSNRFGLMQIIYVVLGIFVGALGILFIKKK